MFWKCYSMGGGENKERKWNKRQCCVCESSLWLSGWMDERQIDWIAGERELCRTWTGRNMWLNLKGRMKNSQWRVLEPAVMSSCCCHCANMKRTAVCLSSWCCKLNTLDKRKKATTKGNWESMWKHLLLRQKGKDKKDDGKRGTRCGSLLHVKPLPLLCAQVFLQTTSQCLSQVLKTVFSPKLNIGGALRLFSWRLLTSVSLMSSWGGCCLAVKLLQWFDVSHQVSVPSHLCF